MCISFIDVLGVRDSTMNIITHDLKLLDYNLHAFCEDANILYVYKVLEVTKAVFRSLATRCSSVFFSEL